jgi:hypothetical protein
MCHFMFPNVLNVGHVIANLKPYQIIVIEKGFGFPLATEEITAVIWKVSGMSAITMCGIVLMCNDGFGVQPTDQLDTSARPTKKARKIFLQIEVRNFSRRIFAPVHSFLNRIKVKILLMKFRISKRRAAGKK